MARRPGKAENPFVEPEVAEDASAVNEHEPKLDLPQLQTGNGRNSSGLPSNSNALKLLAPHERT